MGKRNRVLTIASRAAIGTGGRARLPSGSRCCGSIMLISFLMRVVARLALGVFVRSGAGRRQLRQAMGQIDGDRRPVALRVEDREADVSRDSRLAEGRHERVAE